MSSFSPTDPEAHNAPDAGRHSVNELAGSLGGALDSGPVVSGSSQAHKAPDAGRQTVKELAGSSGGTLDSGPVVRGSSDAKLKIYLGYAAGVGKTYQMLQEGQTALKNGWDVVVGYFEPHARPETTALLTGLEVIPRHTVEYRGSTFTEMDPEAILRRNPQIALIDEFPHTNVPGSQFNKRWEDVLQLIDRGINVWTTMNVQHLESLNDEIFHLAGVRIRETIPDWVVQSASEVVMVDLTPRALLNRLDRGVIYGPEKAESAKKNFFKESNLAALREFALRETAFEIASRQEPSPHYDDARGKGEANTDEPQPNSRRERVLVLLTPQPSTAALVRRGKRVADYFKGECLAVAVCPGGELNDLPPAKRHALEKHLKFARNLHVSTHLLAGNNLAEELVSFAHERAVTQIYLPRPKTRRWQPLSSSDLVRQITRLARDIEITVVSDRVPRPEKA